MRIHRAITFLCRNKAFTPMRMKVILRLLVCARATLPLADLGERCKPLIWFSRAVRFSRHACLSLRTAARADPTCQLPYTAAAGGRGHATPESILLRVRAGNII